jgi:hypothetical protein
LVVLEPVLEPLSALGLELVLPAQVLGSVLAQVLVRAAEHKSYHNG